MNFTDFFKNIRPVIFVSFLVLSKYISAQDSLEIYLIDSYVSLDKPHLLNVSFFTSAEVKSKIAFRQEVISISDEFRDYHELKYDVSEISAESSKINYTIVLIDSAGIEQKFHGFEAELPQDLISPGSGYGALTVCCFGGAIFGLPSPGIAYMNDGQKLSLSKEIPLFSFYSGGYNYPDYYIGIEYTHIPDAEVKNLFGINAKYIKRMPVIEYVSPGVGYATNFYGFNGASAEISAGLFKIYSVFTLYLRCKFVFDSNAFERNFQEISIGLYSNFFSLNF